MRQIALFRYDFLTFFNKVSIFSRARPDTSTLLSSKHPPGLRSLGEGRLEGYLGALQDTLLPQFSFHSKPGTPSKGTEDGDKTVQGERGRKIPSNMSCQFYFCLFFCQIRVHYCLFAIICINGSFS